MNTKMINVNMTYCYPPSKKKKKKKTAFIKIFCIKIINKIDIQKSIQRFILHINIKICKLLNCLRMHS